MKRITLILTWGLVISLTACVDDYTDANPPQKKDAPTLRLSSAGDNNVLVAAPVNAFQTESSVFMTYGEPVEITVSVIDAPGTVGEVSVTSSIPEYGTITIDEASVASLQNKEAGSFKFTFTPADDFEDDSDRSLNLAVSVSDNQVDEKGESAPKTTSVTIPLTFVKCLAFGIQPGYYAVTSYTGNIDGGTAVTLDDLEAGFGERVVVTVEMERPGLYTIDEISGGVWPLVYPTRANPAVQIDHCGTAISGHAGSVTAGAGTAAARTFTVDGSLNEDGTITIDWSYVRDDGATPATPAKGTYTLTRLAGF